MDEKVRYSRHFLVPEIGFEGQCNLKKASILIAGAGGLGSASSLYLAAAGVGRIGIVDSDFVDLSNLQRQVIHSMNSIGQLKVNSALERLNSINPTVHVDAINERLNAGNVNRIISDYTVVLDATDNFETRYRLNQACVLQKKTFIYGAVYRFFGQISVFNALEGPCFQCAFRETSINEQVTSKKEMGIVSPIPGVIGTLQAVEAIKWILNIGDPLIGKLLLFDGLNMSFQKIFLRKDSACPVCSSNGINNS